MLKEFKKFVLRGNLVDLAIGFTVGASFSTVAKSLVNDIIMPPIGFLLGNNDFSDLFLILKQGENAPYETLEKASADGAVTLNYGAFINNVLALIVVALAMFIIMKLISKLDEELDELTGKDKEKKKKEPTNKKCPFCFTVIAYRATKCSACTSKLPKK